MKASTATRDYQNQDNDFRLAMAIQSLKEENIVYTPPLEAKSEKINKQRRTKEIQRVIGERLMLVRKALGLTQTELANIAGLTNCTISHMETGKTCNITSLILYTDAINVPMSVILEGTVRDPKTPYSSRIRH